MRNYSRIGLSFHRSFAAFLASSDRFSEVRASARALPPWRPPKRPNSTAWGGRVRGFVE